MCASKSQVSNFFTGSDLIVLANPVHLGIGLKWGWLGNHLHLIKVLG